MAPLLFITVKFRVLPEQHRAVLVPQRGQEDRPGMPAALAGDLHVDLHVLRLAAGLQHPDHGPLDPVELRADHEIREP
ncbi:hypothetical protein [Actinacidiphila oryziradicis]|uniref:hypothetical protein n=1 Tax=Actinacidiphila oryziradicis TaxID=2571141 RepID=UPI0023F0F9CD|nr:hypothetical protein [Actinacidiphila oryziradicis]